MIPPAAGPFETVTWSSELEGRVVEPGSPPRVHGYDAERDLARYYDLAETTLLALRGELPTREEASAFSVALAFAAPISVASAPSHVAVLARICSGTTSQIVGTVVIALAEQARVLLESQAAFIAWLAAPTGELPSCASARTEEDRASVERLRTALAERGAVAVPATTLGVSRDAAILATLYSAGLVRTDQIETALTWCRLPLVSAEAFSAGPNGYRTYPLNLPPIVYEETAS
jgi:hypothetical protein